MDVGLIEDIGAVEDRHWWYVARREILIAAAERYLPARPESVVDLGCGTGGTLVAFRDAFDPRDLVGLDNEPVCVSACEERGLTVVPGSLTDLPFDDGAFDLVSALDVIEHVEDEHGSAREIARVVSPNGIVLVTAPAYEWLWGPHDDLNHHIRRYTRTRLVATLEASGLEVLYATYFNCYLFPAAAVGRIAERVTGRHAKEYHLPSESVNSALTTVFRAERRRVARGRTLPYGLSVLAVARRADQERRTRGRA